MKPIIHRAIIAAAALVLSVSVTEAFITHKVQKKETLFGIAHQYGVTVDEIIRFNPGAEDGIKKGQDLIIPEPADLAPVEEPDTVELAPPSPVETVASFTATEASDGSIFSFFTNISQNVLIGLPFMSESDEQSRQAALYTDFYKGLLLSFEENGSVLPIKLFAEDIDTNAEEYESLLDTKFKKRVSLIIAPENNDLLEEACNFGFLNSVYVLNLFNVKDESYLHNPYSIQCNIPQQIMYDKAIETVFEEFAGYTPVILSPKGGRTEKDAFVEALCKECKVRGVEVIDLQFGSTLLPDDLGRLKKDGKYVFIPRSGTLNVFNKFASVLSEYRDGCADPGSVRLFGYPDWITFKGDQRRALHALDAVYYSRVFYDPESGEALQVENCYHEWYKGHIMEGVPNQAILGYDTAGLLECILKHGRIAALADLDEIRYSGIQSTFILKRVEGGGFVNTALYIVNCNAGGTYDVTVR